MHPLKQAADGWRPSLVWSSLPQPERPILGLLIRRSFWSVSTTKPTGKKGQYKSPENGLQHALIRANKGWMKLTGGTTAFFFGVRPMSKIGLHSRKGFTSTGVRCTTNAFLEAVFHTQPIFRVHMSNWLLYFFLQNRTTSLSNLVLIDDQVPTGWASIRVQKNTR